MTELGKLTWDPGRLALCGLLAWAVVDTLAEQGKNWSLPHWDRWGTWLQENKLLTAALVTVVLYGALQWGKGEREGNEEAWEVVG